MLDSTQGEAHLKCLETAKRLSSPSILTLPVATEAMYFTYKYGGWPMQDMLWQLLRDSGDDYQIHMPSEGEFARARELMFKYRDVPMDFADATLVAAAEVLNIRTVFTLDSDFQIYRTANGDAFEVFPELSS